MDRLEAVEARLLGYTLDDYGSEIPDPRPVEIPAGFRRPETLAEQVARLVRGQVSRMAAESGEETFEESEDFDVDDDFDPRTPYEEVFDPTLGRSITPDEMRKSADRYRELYLASERNRYREAAARKFERELLHDERPKGRSVDTQQQVKPKASSPSPEDQ